MKFNQDTVIAIIAEHTGIDDIQRPFAIKLESRLAEDLGLDSLDILEIVMSIEDQFNLTIDDEEAEKMKTVGDVVQFVSAAKQAR